MGVEAALRQARRASATLPLPPCEARGTPEFEADGPKKTQKLDAAERSAAVLRKKKKVFSNECSVNKSTGGCGGVGGQKTER